MSRNFKDFQKVFVLKIFKVKWKKQCQWYYFVTEVDVTDKKNILKKESPGRVLQEKCSKLFGKTFWKTRVQRHFSKKISGYKPATLFEERLMKRFSFCFLFYSILRT